MQGTLLGLEVYASTSTRLGVKRKTLWGVLRTGLDTLLRSKDLLHTFGETSIFSPFSTPAASDLAGAPGTEATEPQGITWDGDGTVYVADAAGSKVPPALEGVSRGVTKN